MQDPISDYRQKVWLYREPWRSMFLVVLLALLATTTIPALRGGPDFSETLKSALLVFGLVCLHLGAAYAPLRWRGTAANVTLTLVVGLLVWDLMG